MYSIKYSEVIKRLQEILHTQSDEDIAGGLELTPQTFSQCKKRDSIPYELLVKFCLLRKLSLDWLFIGDQNKQDDYVTIPVYNNVLDPGSFQEREENIDILKFKSNWLKNELRVNQFDLFLLYVDDESMEPTLRAGDIILVVKQKASITRDGIYVLQMDSAALIKRIQRLPGGIVRITSDNLAYQPIEVKLEQIEKGDLAVIGRMVWAGKRF
ncbi:MAG: helix-turn-helix domain-containing protein [Candidatus Brocadiaceae bacterium]|nr:helix-turn-helix domain-containing protein [Candidatus Brocadiaceae bacterium]